MIGKWLLHASKLDQASGWKFKKSSQRKCLRYDWSCNSILFANAAIALTHDWRAKKRLAIVGKGFVIYRVGYGYREWVCSCFAFSFNKACAIVKHSELFSLLVVVIPIILARKSCRTVGFCRRNLPPEDAAFTYKAWQQHEPHGCCECR